MTKKMRLRQAGIAAGAAMTALVAAGLTPSKAAPLDPSVCEQLQVRLDALRKDGVEADMAMGPEAARTRLPIDRFNRIGTFIELDEQLNFRCGLAKQRINLPTTVEGGEEEIPVPGEAAATSGAPASAAVKGGATGTGEAPAKRRPSPPAKKQSKASKSGDTTDGDDKPAPKAAKRTAPAKKAATKRPADGDAGQPAPARKTPPKKAAPPKQPAAKIDDAYRPPPRAAAKDGATPPAVKQ